ncbi:MAG: SpoIID/LytB domain-containing protein [Muribaculaceae bacterium]|jgi:stage II sporulation protein D|nr:SpoIID/LytB domain-containing protein [Muribaculaceae bacterium]
MYDKNTMPTVAVGILTAKAVDIDFHGAFRRTGDGAVVSGSVRFENLDSKLDFEPAEDGAVFEVKDVMIGVDFHWQRRENQTFAGALSLLPCADGSITVVNRIGVEDYLRSVISSEMSATSSPELLRAHAVISRSWLLAQIRKNERIADGARAYDACTVTDDEIVRWQDREDHTDFDVCADDHCQRYQGVTRQSTAAVAEAVDATAGIALTDPDSGELADARFSKCCGGVFELFENCWEPVHHSYLTVRSDAPDALVYPDLRYESRARAWIEASPEAFCNTADESVLSQVLNNYDRESIDFYRWTVRYGVEELSDLVRERTGIDFGTITDLVAVERGTSGRIVRLRITGTKRSMIIGKELEIRHALSRSHLRSSAFVVDRDGDDFVLRGAGWGHGVGLCQIGAAVMAEKGYGWREILAHYFPGAELKKIY